MLAAMAPSLGFRCPPTSTPPGRPGTGVRLGLPPPSPAREHGRAPGGRARGPHRGAYDAWLAGARDQPPADVLPAGGRLRARWASSCRGDELVRVEGRGDVL